MPAELLCPDCGGVVGATETTAAGPPCRCFTGSSSDTAIDFPSPVAKSDAAQPQKLCVVCGKDLAGHRRIKETRGYLCLDCAKDEQKLERNGRVRCRVCGRLVPEASLEDYEGTRMCGRCQAERVKLKKQKIKRMGIASAHNRHEMTRLFILLAVAGFLLMIIILNHFKLLPHFF